MSAIVLAHSRWLTGDELIDRLNTKNIRQRIQGTHSSLWDNEPRQV
jgi:hypothetical protein